MSAVARSAANRYDVAFYMPEAGPLLTDNPVPPAGGAETQIVLLAGALAQTGLRVCICTCDLPGATIASTFRGVDVLIRPPYRGGRGFVFAIREAFTLARAVRLPADVIVTRVAGPHVGIVGLVTKVRRRRFVFSAANVSDFLRTARSRRTRDWLLYRLGLILADAIVVQTEEQARLCRSEFHRPALVVRSIATAAGAVFANPRAFLWVGRIVPYKRPLEFLKLARASPEAEFWMIAVPQGGEDVLGRQVLAGAIELRNLKLLEPRPREKLLELYPEVVAVVNTSEFEGMPNVSLEGWAYGVPTLSLSYDPDDVIERHGLGVCAEGSMGDLVDAARRCWESRKARGFAEQCLAYLRSHHSADAVISEWLAVLDFAPNEHDRVEKASLV